jgi:hypothetical protein
LLVAGCWLLVAGCWLLVAGCLIIHENPPFVKCLSIKSSFSEYIIHTFLSSVFKKIVKQNCAIVRLCAMLCQLGQEPGAAKSRIAHPARVE